MLATLLKTTRPAFLLLTLVLIALAAALAVYHGHSITPHLVGMVLLGALCAHAGVNVLNEVHDAASGLDELTTRTPFSGGSGALQAHPEARRSAALFGWLLIAVVVLLGCYFVSLRGWELLPLGLVGLVLVIAYTPLITRLPWLCLIAPGLGFGPIMLGGAYWVFTGTLTFSVFVVSLVPFLLVNNLLLLNQLPDVEADRQVQRNNVITAYGFRTANRIYRGFLVSAFLGLGALIAIEQLPPLVWISFATLPAAIWLYRGVLRTNTPLKLPPSLLAVNVILTLSIPALMAIALLLS
ncbi:MAG: prenyltransferase [Idiomarinaceae bacterium]|nr:prenyltransferase [Idiomarinaceae bacterium]|tara:strand:- start:557 stop:1444 length:888 start_codon:yes stop_codon:yes gene_type:complete